MSDIERQYVANHRELPLQVRDREQVRVLVHGRIDLATTQRFILATEQLNQGTGTSSAPRSRPAGGGRGTPTAPGARRYLESAGTGRRPPYAKFP